MLTLLISTLFNLCLPNLSGSLVDSITLLFDDPNDSKNSLSPKSPPPTMPTKNLTLHTVLFYLFLTMIGTGVSTFVRNYCMALAGERIVCQLNKQLFTSVLKQEVAFFDVNRSGELLNRLSSDTRSIQMALSLQAEYICRHCVEVIGCIVILVSISLKLLLFMLLLVPTGTIAMTLMSRYVSRVSVELQDALARANGVAHETLSNMKTVKSLGIRDLQSEKYGEAMDEAFGRSQRLALVNSLIMGASIMMGVFSVAGVLWYGGQLVMNRELTVGKLASFLAYTVFLSYSVSNLSHWYFSMLKFLGATKRVHELLNRRPLIDNKSSSTGGAPPSLVELPGESEGISIEFRGVSFSYPTRPDTIVLHNVNLSLKPGKIVALVGVSGGGKSSICNLVQRFYDPNEGTILVNGVDLRDIDLKWLSKHVGTVSQEPHLFSTSIYNNILFGRLDASTEQIIEASKAAHAHDFISEFPQGYETPCGERGSLMSGGQKQRIALARCFVQQPSVLLIDEGTSALDSESEHQVQLALTRIAKGRTVLMIAHRLSTVQMADEICVIKEGRIIERGSHEQLIHLNGTYHRLVKLQELQ